MFPLTPDPSGHFNLLREAIDKTSGSDPGAEEVFGAWNPAGRIEIHRFEGLEGRLPGPLPLLFYSQDGSAASLLLGTGGDPSRMGRRLAEKTMGILMIIVMTPMLSTEPSPNTAM